jgi:hypothetical protein
LGSLSSSRTGELLKSFYATIFFIVKFTDDSIKIIHFLQVTSITFKKYVTNTVFPLFKIERSISCPTATQWMMSLGYLPQEHWKTLYFDGHKQPDVLEARKKYIKDFDTYCKRSRIYSGNNLEIAA